MKNYVPKADSLAARLIAHLTEYGSAARANDIALLFDVAPKNIVPSLVAAVDHGALIKTTANGRLAYCLPGAEPAEGPDAPAPRTRAPARPKAPKLAKPGKTPTPASALTVLVPAVDANTIQHGGAHYKGMVIQPWDYVAANGMGYFEGNAVKYLTRWRDKGGLQDLRKAGHFIDKLIEVETARGTA